MNIYITGPTASGKTKLAIEISKFTGLPIYNCDSRQFWKSMQLITCSPSIEEKSLASHNLFNFLEDDEKPSLGHWMNLLPIGSKIIVGGTAFYIESLLRGIPITDISQKTISLVDSIENPYEFLKERLEEKFPKTLKKEDKYRVYRLLQFYLETGDTFETFPRKKKEEGLVIIVNPNINFLSTNIKNRVEECIESWIKEVKYSSKNINFEKIIGYKEIWEFLNNKYSLNDLKEKIYLKTIKYAKSQKKFIKRLPAFIELDILDSLDPIYEKLSHINFFSTHNIQNI